MSLEEATISNIWEIAEIVELLEQKGPLHETRSPHHDRRATPEEPRARTPETAFPESCLLPENTIIDKILELLNKIGLTSHESMKLLERWGGIIEMGHRAARETMH